MDLRDQAAKLSLDDIAALLGQVQVLSDQVRRLDERVQQQDHLLNWYRRQLFGARSERRILDVLPLTEQMWLGEQMLDVPEEPPPSGTTVKSYERSSRRKQIQFVDSDSRLRFDESVPVQVIEVPNPELEEIPAEIIQEISEKVTYRLAQRSPYVVLKYVQQVVKRTDTGQLLCPPVPPAIIERSFADVSFLAGMVVDKFAHHLPLYRQHQRLENAGVVVDRGTLTRLVHRTGELVEPIYNAVLSSVVLSRVLTVDESPTPAGVEPRKPGTGKPGKMKRGYFWALYGDQDEVAFVFAPSRARLVLDALLEGFEGTLLTDGYKAYESYVKVVTEMQRKVQHAQCWSHTRRNFTDAELMEPQKVEHVLKEMQRLYLVEDKFADARPEVRLSARQQVSLPIVDGLFRFFHQEFETTTLLPSNPYLEAIEYAVAREAHLRVFLNDPSVPIDTNHVERALRPPAVGRKNWMFHVTEVGARYAAMFYTLIESCKLCGVDPVVYLVDILQRIDRHPASEVQQLVPRHWKEHFSQQPLRSDVGLSP